jgi:ABC-type phosphate transport system ATPase subunit
VTSALGSRRAPRPVADAGSVTEFIEIRGARENNLKDVSLRIPKRKITIFTGVSGSGNDVLRELTASKAL